MLRCCFLSGGVGLLCVVFCVLLCGFVVVLLYGVCCTVVLYLVVTCVVFRSVVVCCGCVILLLWFVVLWSIEMYICLLRVLL